MMVANIFAAALGAVLRKPSVPGSISAITTTTPSGENVTAAAYLDWNLWTAGGATLQRKNGANLISGPSTTNASSPGTGATGPTNTWTGTDGTPTASGSSNELKRYDMTSAAADCFVDFTLPAGTGPKKAGIIAGAYFDAGADSTVNVRFTLSDGSAADRTATLDRSQGANNPPTFKYYEVTYNAATAGKTLRVRIENLTAGHAGTGCQVFLALVRYGN
jgi:hypothetical protein